MCYSKVPFHTTYVAWQLKPYLDELIIKHDLLYTDTSIEITVLSLKSNHIECRSQMQFEFNLEDELRDYLNELFVAEQTSNCTTAH